MTLYPTEPCANCGHTPAVRQFRSGKATNHFLCATCDQLEATHYQCDTCGRFHPTFNEGRACHSGLVVFPNPNRTVATTMGRQQRRA